MVKFSWKWAELLSKHAFAGGMFSPFSLNVTIIYVKTQRIYISWGSLSHLWHSNKATEGHAFHTNLSTACTNDVLHDAEHLCSCENVKPSLETSMFYHTRKKKKKRGNVIRAKNKTELTFSLQQCYIFACYTLRGLLPLLPCCLLIGGKRSMHKWN